jgi:hypothetical protein
MEFKIAVFGQHGLAIWFASLLWSFIGAVIVKVKYLPADLKWKNFSFKVWLGENAFDFIKSIVYAILILRLGDLTLQLFEKYYEKIPVQIDDFVVLTLFISIYIQYKLHNSRKNKTN